MSFRGLVSEREEGGERATCHHRKWKMSYRVLIFKVCKLEREEQAKGSAQKRVSRRRNSRRKRFAAFPHPAIWLNYVGLNGRDTKIVKCGGNSCRHTRKRMRGTEQKAPFLLSVEISCPIIPSFLNVLSFSCFQLSPSFLSFAAHLSGRTRKEGEGTGLQSREGGLIDAGRERDFDVIGFSSSLLPLFPPVSPTLSKKRKEREGKTRYRLPPKKVKTNLPFSSLPLTDTDLVHEKQVWERVDLTCHGETGRGHRGQRGSFASPLFSPARVPKAGQKRGRHACWNRFKPDSANLPAKEREEAH